MSRSILAVLRQKIRSRDYVMTLHAEAEMDQDELSIFDVESAILKGRIVARQRDIRTAERKYLVRGVALDADQGVVVAVKLGPTGKLVVLTVYAE